MRKTKEFSGKKCFESVSASNVNKTVATNFECRKEEVGTIFSRKTTEKRT